MKTPIRLPQRRKWGTPQRYRLDFINENTFNRVWSLKFSRLQVIVVSAVVFTALIALLWMILRFTPLGMMLPGETQADMRRHLVELGIRADSLQTKLRILDDYYSNMMSVFEGRPTESRVSSVISEDVTLIDASDAERAFVDEYDPAGHFSLSVLSPIAAEGMAFYSPLVDPRVDSAPDAQVAVLSVNEHKPAMAVYGGTVIAVGRDAQGYVLTVQHGNNFISQYSGLESIYVKKESRVNAGDALGNVAPGQPLLFEMWHDGVAVPPSRLIAF